MLRAQDKILPLDRIQGWRIRFNGQTLVVSNGTFDIIHAGHIHCLEEARSLGDGLIVGLNSDASVRALKGNGRPVNNERDRAIVLAALSCVTAVCIFEEPRATKFLELAAPDVYVKGGDYTLETLDKSERGVLEAVGSRIEFIPTLLQHSTTDLIARFASCQNT